MNVFRSSSIKRVFVAAMLSSVLLFSSSFVASANETRCPSGPLDLRSEAASKEGKKKTKFKVWWNDPDDTVSGVENIIGYRVFFWVFRVDNPYHVKYQLTHRLERSDNSKYKVTIHRKKKYNGPEYFYNWTIAVDCNHATHSSDDIYVRDQDVSWEDGVTWENIGK